MHTQNAELREEEYQFVSKTPAFSIRFKNRFKHPIKRLPFHSSHPEKPGPYYWNVPQSGGYFGGCTTGSNLALIYLKHLKEHGYSSYGCLQNIALDMFDHDRDKSEASDSLRGQVVGFFSLLDEWLFAAASQHSEALDTLDSKKLLRTANDGLNFDSNAYMTHLASLPDPE